MGTGTKPEKISIIYHSGVGNTELVAKIMHLYLLKQGLSVYMKSVEEKIDVTEIQESSAIIMGCPTYHGKPSMSMLDFIDEDQIIIPELKGKRCYVFATCGLYPANTLRIFAKKIYNKGIIPVHSSWYRMSATDGILLVPQISFFRTFEKGLVQKISANMREFVNFVMGKQDDKLCEVKIPRIKIYSILNYPNKKMGEIFKATIKIANERCIRCFTCVKGCYRSCMSADTDGNILYDTKKCENCYRCIHNCPSAALSNSGKKPHVLLSGKFFGDYYKKVEISMSLENK